MTAPPPSWEHDLQELFSMEWHLPILTNKACIPAWDRHSSAAGGGEKFSTSRDCLSCPAHHGGGRYTGWSPSHVCGFSQFQFCAPVGDENQGGEGSSKVIELAFRLATSLSWRHLKLHHAGAKEILADLGGRPYGGKLPECCHESVPSREKKEV